MRKINKVISIALAFMMIAGSNVCYPEETLRVPIDTKYDDMKSLLLLNSQMTYLDAFVDKLRSPDHNIRRPAVMFYIYVLHPMLEPEGNIPAREYLIVKLERIILKEIKPSSDLFTDPTKDISDILARLRHGSSTRPKNHSYCIQRLIEEVSMEEVPEEKTGFPSTFRDKVEAIVGTGLTNILAQLREALVNKLKDPDIETEVKDRLKPALKIVEAEKNNPTDFRPVKAESPKDIKSDETFWNFKRIGEVKLREITEKHKKFMERYTLFQKHVESIKEELKTIEEQEAWMQVSDESGTMGVIIIKGDYISFETKDSRFTKIYDSSPETLAKRLWDALNKIDILKPITEKTNIKYWETYYNLWQFVEYKRDALDKVTRNLYNLPSSDLYMGNKYEDRDYPEQAAYWYLDSPLGKDHILIWLNRLSYDNNWDYHSPGWSHIEQLLTKLGIDPKRIAEPKVIDEKGNPIEIDERGKKRLLLLELHDAILHSSELPSEIRTTFRMLIILYIYGVGYKRLPQPFTQSSGSELNRFIEEMSVPEFLEILWNRLGAGNIHSIFDIRGKDILRAL